MCKHNAYLNVPGGIKCLLCGAIIPENQEAPATAEKQPEKAAPEAKPGKTAPAKKTPRAGK